MDRMTTLSAFAVSWVKRLRVHWPALLLPVLVIALSRLVRPYLWHDPAGPWVSLWVPFQVSALAAPWLKVALGLAVLAVVFVPAAAARVAALALLGYGFVGLFIAHYLLLWRPFARASTGSCPPGRRACQ